MATITDYYKIVSPQTATTVVTDSQALGQGYAYGNNSSWYQRLVQGSASRVSKYREYDLMDNDVEVARALDIIAESMTRNNTKTDLPLNVRLQVEDGQSIPNNIVPTVRGALRFWCNMHKFSGNALFKLSRNMIKYGDCFFRTDNPGNKWVWIPPSDVVGAVVAEDDITEIVAYQVRVNTRAAVTATHTNQSAITGMTEIIDVSQMVVFSISDGMSETAPFGDSALRTVYKTHKQKELLEDSIVIYRIQRAPERRVFYISTGKMHPNRVQQYLEGIKNEIRQKSVPSKNANGTNAVDAVYNPQSTMEDIFLSAGADGKGTKVDVLPGGQSLGELSDLDYFMDKVLRGLRVPISWMKTGVNSAMFNDGKVGAAYIEEQQFAIYVERLQVYIDDVMDTEFKKFLFSCGVNIDNSLFKITLPAPSNYEHYQQAEMDNTLLSSYGSADAIPYMSKRFAMSRFLQMTDDEIATNEMLRCQELGIPHNKASLSIIYGNPDAAGGMGGMGGMGGGMDMGMGGMGGGMDMGAPLEGEPAEGGEAMTPAPTSAINPPV